MLAGPSATIDSTLPRMRHQQHRLHARYPYYDAPSILLHHTYLLLFAAGYRHIFYHLQKWFMQFSQICFFCRPVIHFSIDIDSVFAVPWRTAVYCSRFPAGWLAGRRAAKMILTGNVHIDNTVLQIADHWPNKIFQRSSVGSFAASVVPRFKLYPVKIFLVSSNVFAA